MPGVATFGVMQHIDSPDGAERKIPTGIGLRPSMRREVDALAEHDRRSRSYIIEQAIQEYLERRRAQG